MTAIAVGLLCSGCADGTEVTVTDGDAAVVTIGLMEVPGGYVVASYDACAGAISGA